MKNIILFIVLFIGLENLAFTRILYKADTEIQIVGVESDDTLNLRRKPTHKSNIVISMPYNSKNLIFLKNNDCNKWVNVAYYDMKSNTQYNGWVNEKFISPIDKTNLTTYQNLEISYPAYLHAKEEKDGISFKYYVPYKFKQWANGKDGVKSFNRICNFCMNIKIYKNLKSALKANYISNYNFKDNSFKMPKGVSKIKNSKVVSLGVEGVRQILTIKNINDKTIVASLFHNSNKIRAKQEPKCEIFDFKRKLQLQNQIINSIKSASFR